MTRGLHNASFALHLHQSQRNALGDHRLHPRLFWHPKAPVKRNRTIAQQRGSAFQKVTLPR